MKSIIAISAILIAGVGAQARAMNCGAANKELIKLRNEYHNYVVTSSKSNSTQFDELTRILDRIVTLKDEMRKSNCKIPPRP